MAKAFLAVVLLIGAVWLLLVMMKGSSVKATACDLLVEYTLPKEFKTQFLETPWMGVPHPGKVRNTAGGSTPER